jgi:hypothetical protein
MPLQQALPYKPPYEVGQCRSVNARLLDELGLVQALVGRHGCQHSGLSRREVALLAPFEEIGGDLRNAVNKMDRGVEHDMSLFG